MFMKLLQSHSNMNWVSVVRDRGEKIQNDFKVGKRAMTKL